MEESLAIGIDVTVHRKVQLRRTRLDFRKPNLAPYPCNTCLLAEEFSAEPPPQLGFPRRTMLEVRRPGRASGVRMLRYSATPKNHTRKALRSVHSLNVTTVRGSKDLPCNQLLKWPPHRGAYRKAQRMVIRNESLL